VGIRRTRRLHERLRQAILDRRLKAASSLPASRDFGSDAGAVLLTSHRSFSDTPVDVPQETAWLATSQKFCRGLST
jgi:hypothetical protein